MTVPEAIVLDPIQVQVCPLITQPEFGVKSEKFEPAEAPPSQLVPLGLQYDNEGKIKRRVKFAEETFYDRGIFMHFKLTPNEEMAILKARFGQEPWNFDSPLNSIREVSKITRINTTYVA